MQKGPPPNLAKTKRIRFRFAGGIALFCAAPNSKEMPLLSQFDLTDEFINGIV